MTKTFLTVLCLLGLLLHAQADERILSYQSHIAIDTNATVTVTETLRVRAEHIEINRGIYRDVPTTYTNALGHTYRVGFHVESVLHDGRPATYAVEPLHNGVRIRIGDADVTIPKGEHTYDITYQTDRQIGYFEDYDELYWNVTGDAWSFPIDEALATVSLPESIDPGTVGVTAFTGSKGQTGDDFTSDIDSEGMATVEATRPLRPGEGLTIAVNWPKGHVHVLTQAERLQYLLRDNRSALAALAGLAAVLIYYFFVWLAVGKDPSKGAIIPLYEPPNDISPAAARYLWKMAYDDKCFAASLINLGVKGHLEINESKKKSYSIVRIDGPAGRLALEEQKIYMKLLGRRQELEFKTANHQAVSGARNLLKKALAATYEKNYFLTNRKIWAAGVAIAALTLVGMVLLGKGPGQAFFMGIWLSFWSIGAFALAMAVGVAWKKVFTGPNPAASLFGALGITAFSLPFIGGEIFGLYMLSQATSMIAMAFFVVLVLVVILFYQWMKAPTLLGRKTMDQIEGFRLYLSVAEQDRMKFSREPTRTPELFERFLPYALALDVEQEWAEYFAKVLATSANAPQHASHQTHTTWYSSAGGGHLHTAAFAGAVGGALAGAISSSATSPGSSSGSSGGGFSGGGGGGGGGGGW